MTTWIRVRKTDNRITGWHTTSANGVPEETSVALFVSISQIGLNAYLDMENTLRADGRNPEIFYRNEQFEFDVDTRPSVRVELSKLEVLADGVDTLTLTVSVLRANGSVNTSFSGTRKFDIFGKLLKLDFISGVCVKQLKFNTSGRYEQRSNAVVKLEAPISLEVLE